MKRLVLPLLWLVLNLCLLHYAKYQEQLWLYVAQLLALCLVVYRTVRLAWMDEYDFMVRFGLCRRHQSVTNISGVPWSLITCISFTHLNMYDFALLALLPGAYQRVQAYWYRQSRMVP